MRVSRIKTCVNLLTADRMKTEKKRRKRAKKTRTRARLDRRVDKISHPPMIDGARVVGHRTGLFVVTNGTY